MHATAMLRVAAKVLMIASWTPANRQMRIVLEAVTILEARARLVV